MVGIYVYLEASDLESYVFHLLILNISIIRHLLCSTKVMFVIISQKVCFLNYIDVPKR